MGISVSLSPNPTIRWPPGPSYRNTCTTVSGPQWTLHNGESLLKKQELTTLQDMSYDLTDLSYWV